jgi:hypothetical protein
LFDILSLCVVLIEDLQHVAVAKILLDALGVAWVKEFPPRVASVI